MQRLRLRPWRAVKAQATAGYVANMAALQHEALQHEALQHEALRGLQAEPRAESRADPRAEARTPKSR